MKEITLKINGVEMDVEFYYIPGEPGEYDLAPEDCYPDEPPYVEILKVYLKVVDLYNTGLLCHTIVDTIEAKIIELAKP